LTAAFVDDPGVFVWDRAGDNPYRAILALSDRLVVTGDSVSMISEAVSTPLPVEVFDPGIPRYRGFIAGLIASDRIRRFDGDPQPPPAGEPINATRTAADAVRALLQARTGLSG
jgi:mitochondrial fission protein ELM1